MPCSINRTPLMQDLPHHTAEPMGDGPDGGLIAQARQQAAEHHLKVTAFPLDRSVRRLVQHPPQIFIAFGGATAVILFGTFVFPGTGSHPRGHSAAEGNVLACSPTSAMICCAESTPKPGTSARRITA